MSMSAFSGILEEYPKLAIDSFIPLVSTYFISHLHLDHIVGFDQFIPLPNVKIYTSHTTAQLIKSRHREFKGIQSFVQGLEVGNSYNIDISRVSFENEGDNRETESIKVTLIPAGHCLGSVMFLIDGLKGSVLYTGDFRILINDSRKIKEKYKIGHLKTIYLDTTFFNRKCLYLPSREQSVLAMLDIIERFLLESPENLVHIYISTRYTLEILYHMIYLRFNIKVHVHWEYYAQLSQLEDCFISCIDHINFNSRIHACYLTDHDSLSKICSKRFEKAKSKNHFLKIIPSAIWWVERGLRNEDIVHWVDSHTVRVCFSSHSSYSEIMDLIMTLPSDSIRDCVLKSDSDFNHIQNLLAAPSFDNHF